MIAEHAAAVRVAMVMFIPFGTKGVAPQARGDVDLRPRDAWCAPKSHPPQSPFLRKGEDKQAYLRKGEDKYAYLRKGKDE